MARTRREIEEEAIGWTIRLRDGAGEDWEAFTAWLEADPEHLNAYEEVALADRAAEELPRSLPGPFEEPAPIPQVAAARPNRRAFLGWAVAASVVLTAGYVALGSRSGVYAVETGLGERREIVLADGSRIALNGATRIVLDEDRPRFARLEKGEALFRIVHDASRPFDVKAGDSLLRDLGTVFNVLHEDGVVEVAVSEGAVLFNPEGEAANLSPGMAARKAPDESLSIERQDIKSVGGWREQRLIYSAAPVSRIAADLSRNLGVTVTASDEAGARPFSGLIMLHGEPSEVLQRASLLLGLELRREGDGWKLIKRTGGPG